MKRTFPHLLLLATMVACEMDVPAPPDAKFTVENAGCEAPCIVTFTSTAENATTVEWDFDDGSPIAKGTKISHEFKYGKSFLVKLVAKNSEGLSDGVTQPVEVKAEPAKLAKAKFSVTLDKNTPPATAKFENEAENGVSYEWDFGDPESGNQNKSTEQEPTHIYTKAKKYTVSLIAFNSGGKPSTPFTVDIEIKDQAPTADFTIVNDNCEAPCNVSFNATANNAISYSWDFGGNGTSEEKSPEHTFNTPGTYEVKLIVKGPGGEFTVTKKVTIRAKALDTFTIKGTFNFPSHIISDPAGNVYVCGAMAGTADFGSGKILTTSDDASNSDFYIAKYNPSGECLWAYADGSSFQDQANGLAVDDAGNIYVTGLLGGSPRKSSGYKGGFVAKLTGNGDLKWFQSFGGVDGSEGRSVAFYRTKNGPKVYVAGTIWGQAENKNIILGNNLIAADAHDIFLVFYDSETGAVGQPLVVGGPNSQSISAMVVDNEGSAYLTGTFDGVMTFSGAQGRLSSYGRVDGFVAKWSLSKGDWEWAKNMGTSADDYGYDLAIDDAKSVYTTGTYKGSMFPLGVGSAGDMGVYIAKWRSDGQIIWGKSGCNDGLDDFAGGIAIGPGGNVIVAASYSKEGQMPFGGKSFTSSGSTDMIIAELHHSQENGAATGRFQATGGGSGQDRAIRVCVAPDGTVYNTGWFTGAATFNGVQLNSGGARNTYIVKYKY